VPVTFALTSVTLYIAGPFAAHCWSTQTSSVPQATQAAPLSPQALLEVPLWQPPEVAQQPLAQLVGSHFGVVQAPPLQRSAPLQLWQLPPPKPQADLAVPGWQSPLWQHPVQLEGEQPEGVP